MTLRWSSRTTILIGEGSLWDSLVLSALIRERNDSLEFLSFIISPPFGFGHVDPQKKV